MEGEILMQLKSLAFGVQWDKDILWHTLSLFRLPSVFFQVEVLINMPLYFISEVLLMSLFLQPCLSSGAVVRTQNPSI